MKNLKTIGYLLVVSLLGLASCDKNDDVTATPTGEVTSQSSKGFVMSLRTAGDTETDFIVSKEDIMTGEVSAVGTGIEQINWRFFYPVGKTLFSTGYSEDNQGAGYGDNGKGFIEKKGSFIFDNALEMFGHTNDNKTFLAMEIARDKPTRRLHLIDANTVLVKKINDIEIFQELNLTDSKKSILSWPTALEIAGDKLFIPFHKIDPLLNTTDPNQAYVAVYSYPNIGSKPEKIITDDRTSNIGVNGSTTGLVEVNNGDLYSFSCGAKMAGFTAASTKPSAILRIKKGATEFDKDYFFDIEKATNGGKIFSLDYAQGNKAVARILTNDNGAQWSAYGRDAVAFNQKLVIIDFEAKTVTDVENTPLHAIRYSSPMFIENGKAYVSVETATEANVYQIDIATAKGTKGAKIIGKTIKGFYKL